MKGQAYIRNSSMTEEKDLGEYGVTLIRGWKEALMKPLTPKDSPTNTSRLEDGKRVLVSSTVRYKDRDLQVQMLLEGTSSSDYLSKLEALMTVIAGRFELRIPSLNNTIYKFVYSDCKKYGNYGDKRGIFTLALNEPNPKDHTSDYD